MGDEVIGVVGGNGKPGDPGEILIRGGGMWEVGSVACGKWESVVCGCGKCGMWGIGKCGMLCGEVWHVKCMWEVWEVAQNFKRNFFFFCLNLGS